MISNDCLNNSQMTIGYNVRIDQRDAITNKLLKRVEGKNTVTKLALMGIIRLFNGQFVGDSIIDSNNYVPRYLALGTNGRYQEGNIIPTISNNSSSVGVQVNANDSSLYQEIDESRIKLTQTNVVENNLNTNYVKLRIKCFIPAEKYNGTYNESTGEYSGTIIEEAGLFTRETGNNCWARYVMPTGTLIHKNSNSVIDITWEITVMSSSSAQYPSVINCLLDPKNNPTLNIKIHKDSEGNIIEIPVDLYGVIELSPINTNMKTVYFVVNNDPNKKIFTVNNRGIGTVIGPGTVTVTATTVNNISTTFTVIITEE